MTVWLASLVHPVVSRALVEAEQKAKDGTLETLPWHRSMALRPEENTSGPLSAMHTPPTSPKEAGFQLPLPPPPPSSPISPPQETPTPLPACLTPDTEYRIIEAELANCALTREALLRRESVLRERKAEIVRETKMRLAKEVRELATRDQEEELEEGLFMRDVQRRVEEKLQKADVREGALEEKEKVQKTDNVEEKKVVPVSAPERRRLARLALLKHDPRLR